MTSIDDELENRIQQGQDPLNALLDILAPQEEHPQEEHFREDHYLRKYWNERLAKNKPYGSDPTDFIKFSGVLLDKGLALSDDLLYRYFIYPPGNPSMRGRAITDMAFLDLTQVELGDQPLLLPYDNQPYTPMVIRIESEEIPVPTFGLIEGDLYIPILRYEALFTKTSKTDYNPDIHCGTYYYFDPGPNRYLYSTQTFISPHPALTYFHLLGANQQALETVVNDTRKKVSPANDDLFREWLLTTYELVQHPERITQPMEIFSDWRKNIESKLCQLARSRGIEVLVNTFTFVTDGISGKYLTTEVVDIRPREVSYASVVEFV